ncbi:MAG TPA: T9SS type A sorting domain-containing protein [Desulfobacterales bacterium]|nr:T9SS type A sorting domain-containing protein [Desulfobacterales bacterium]
MRLLCFTILSLSAVSLFGDWQVTPVWTDGFAVGIGIGPGRDDDTNRLYITHITANTIKEFTYDGTWTNTSNISLPFYAEKPLEICDGRNDGKMRVYTGEFWNEGRAAEYTWNGASWDYTAMGSAGQQLLNLVAGDGRNDGVVRLYYSTGSSPPNNVALEYSYSGGWTHAPISAPSGYWMGNFGIDLGDGRNDGVNRLYIGLFPGYAFAEFTWNGSGWTPDIIATGLTQVMACAVGDGRNDNTNRVYALCRYEGVREYTYSGGNWVLTATIPVSGSSFGLALGSARNDNVNRLYIVTYEGTAYEATYTSGWQLSTIGNPGGSLIQVRLGSVHNDNKLRVYVAGSNGIYEYEWTPGVEEGSEVATARITAPTMFRDRISLELNYNPQGPVEVAIYNTLGVQVYKQTFAKSSNRILLSGDRIARLRSGVYFLQVRTDQIERLKLIKP